MVKDVNRSAYTKRILEIVANIKKQKNDIDKVDAYTRQKYIVKNLQYVLTNVCKYGYFMVILKHAHAATFNINYIFTKLNYIQNNSTG